MKLYYCKNADGIKNFGDDLNPWLWGKLLPAGLLAGDGGNSNETTLFVGVGTVLNDRLPVARKTAVFGSGVGYGSERGASLPAINNAWVVYCVRGPLSAQKLGLPKDAAVTDGAVLVRRIYVENVPKKFRYSYIPHVSQACAASSEWESLCHDLQIQYIDPRWPLQKVLRHLNQTEILLAEAMHGAIIADALRVPWIAVSASPMILSFKWHDWCASIGVTYAPRRILPLWRKSATQPLIPAIKNWGKRKIIAGQLKNIIKTGRPCLSSNDHIESLTCELEGRLEKFKRDVRNNCFD